MKDSLAYQIRLSFLEERYSRLPSDALGGLLGELNLLADGKPADSAIIAEWESAVDSVKGRFGYQDTPQRQRKAGQRWM